MVYRWVRSLICCCLFAAFTTAVVAQNICDGNLGENIFDDGDFGSGTANFLPSDPGIAPGYIYQTNPPPDDGFYIITNDIGGWDWVYDAWLTIGDNSQDPNGYMMVVNATFAPGIFYENIVDNLCENTLYEFSADIINLIRSGTPNHNDPNVDFLLDDQVVYSTGVIPKNEIWNKYGFTFTTNPGQTSLKLSLRNNAPGGIGNDLALDNISFRACGPSAFVNAETNVLLCENGQGLLISAEIPDGQFIQWQISYNGGGSWNNILGATDLDYFHENLSPGTYLYRYFSATTPDNLLNSKCRIISDIFSVEVLPITFQTERITCEGNPIQFGPQTIGESGTYVESFVSNSGCDSIVTLELNVSPNPDFGIEYDFVNPACGDQFPGAISIASVADGIPPFEFFINGNQSPDGEFTNLLEGEYTILIVDSIGCTDSFVQELEDEVPFFINIGPDITLDLGETYTPNVSHNFNLNQIEWTGNGSLSCNDCLDPEIFPLESGVYIIEVENEFGCIESDSIYITVDNTKRIYIPNAFSPDGNGINDQFQVYGNVDIISRFRTFVLYDRWGNQIVNLSGNEEIFWDGRANGKRLSTGVFTYFIEIEFIDGEVMKRTGTITIIR